MFALTANTAGTKYPPEIHKEKPGRKRKNDGKLDFTGFWRSIHLRVYPGCPADCLGLGYVGQASEKAQAHEKDLSHAPQESGGGLLEGGSVMLNTSSIMGRLVADPELKHTPSGGHVLHPGSGPELRKARGRTPDRLDRRGRLAWGCRVYL